MAGFIIGFDKDDEQTFDQQLQFINNSGIQAAMVGLLIALPKTALYKRLQRENRLKDDPYQGDNTKIGTNVIPKRMSYDAMLKHYQTLHTKLFSDSNIVKRVRNKCRHLKHPTSNQEYSLADTCRLVCSFLHKGLLQGGMLRVLRFSWTMITTSPRNWRQVITDWITALSMRDYVQRHFQTETEYDAKLVYGVIKQLKSRFASNISKGVLTIASELKGHKPNLRIDLTGYIDDSFFDNGRQRLVTLLQKSNALLTLNIKQLSAQQLPQLENMLERLSPFGDRITIWANDPIRPILSIDSSVFQYMLGNTGIKQSD